MWPGGENIWPFTTLKFCPIANYFAKMSSKLYRALNYLSFFAQILQIEPKWKNDESGPTGCNWILHAVEGMMGGWIVVQQVCITLLGILPKLLLWPNGRKKYETDYLLIWPTAHALNKSLKAHLHGDENATFSR